MISVDLENNGFFLSEESRNWLWTNATHLLSALPEAEDYPEEIDPTNWLRIENQQQQGSCQGHSLSSNLEGAYYKATGGVIQFSRQAAYIWSQQESGIRGDRGSTVSGGVKAAMNIGLCREELWPYSGRYVTSPPSGDTAGCKADAANYKISGFTPLDSYDGALKFLRSGLGFLHTGFGWDNSMDRQASSGVIENWGGGRGGGHSVCFPGYSKRIDSQGRPYLRLFNSWDTRWGHNGQVEVSPSWFDAMCHSNNSEVVGLHKMILGPNAIRPQIHWN
jgi:C1A family cysteine protease